eukprot:UN05323
MADYKSIDHENLGNFKLSLKIMNPRLQEVFKNEDLIADDKILYTTTSTGSHQLCFLVGSEANPTKSKYKFQLYIDVGTDNTNYEELARVEHLSSIEVEVRRLNDKIRTIRAEQLYQKKQEEEFRDLSELINEKVVWWSLVQAGVIVLT